MFSDANLSSHLQSSSTVEIESVALTEINLNVADNINVIGNYKNRPSSNVAAHSTFAIETADTVTKYYYGFTDSDDIVDGGYDQSDNPISFVSNDVKKKMLFSLEDCFLKFRPRSGINKAMFFGSTPGHYVHHTTSTMMSRPRYYMGHKNDQFKYWTSHRIESEVVSGSQYVGVERGISNNKVSGKEEYYIDDAAPFIVYKEAIPTNRVILKMQTHVGTSNSGVFFNGTTTSTDPLFDAENLIANRSVPINWEIQYLDADGTTWQTLKSFTSDDNADAPLIPRDGYLELHYAPSGWEVKTSTPDNTTLYLTELTSPTVIDLDEGKFAQFQYIKGLRVIVNTMSKRDATFDLIELSPRLACDLSGITSDFSINKVASDLGTSGLPVGQLLVSTGNISLYDYDQAFNVNNKLVYTKTEGTGSVTNPDGSVIAPYIGKNVQVKMYEIIKNVPQIDNPTSTDDYYIPLKTMYVDTFPEIDANTRVASLDLRDLYFYFESLTAPELFIKDTSLSYAIAMLFDSIGFSNYVYLKSPTDDEPIIPYFYSSPNTTVAEVLQELAISTQTAMFFNEYNDFVLMSKSYMLPMPGDRLPSAPEEELDLTLYGSDDLENNKLANIQKISDKSKDVYNAGKIVYTSRYIQKSYTEIRQASLVDEGHVWKYKPVLLWEIAPSESTKSINEQKSSQSSYNLAAIPLNTDLSADLPTVVDGEIVNNVMDLGEGIYWISRYNGYFYANREIIRYDAVEYSVPGQDPSNVWINSVEEYQKYFSQIPFGGKMYPTGRVRIFTEPKYNEDGSIKDGAVGKHGRGQFATKVTSHNSGLDSYWTSNDNIRGMTMDSGKLFGEVEKSNDENSTDDVQEDALAKNRIRIISGGVKDTKTFVVDDESAKKLFNPNTEKKNRFYQTIVGIGNNKKAIRKNTEIASFDRATKTVTLNKTLIKSLRFYTEESNAKEGELRVVSTGTTPVEDALPAATAIDEQDITTPSGQINSTLAQNSTRTSIIRNFLSSTYVSETDLNSLSATQSGTIQSSALVFTGPTQPVDANPLDYVSYIYKDVDSAFRHVGTRMRIVGTLENNGDTQTPTGASQMFKVETDTPDVYNVLNGSSGGVGIMINEDRNYGYFFEIAALTSNNVKNYLGKEYVSNVFFYKTSNKTGNDSNTKSRVAPLWTSLTNIIVDDGNFTGQYRLKGDTAVSVYDLAIEYEVLEGDNGIKFYLYINNTLVQTVIDKHPLPITNTMAIFVRGESKIMFENVFAIGSDKPGYFSDTPLRAVLDTNMESNSDESLRGYKIPEAVSSSYLSGLSPISAPKQNLYFEEFGTIMRECAYMNIKYDKAYPSLISKIAPTFNKIKGYTVAGFSSGAYGAEFLIFNITDTTLNLDETSGNYLRILGVTFTQESKNDYTVDTHFLAASDFSNQDSYDGSQGNVIESKETYQRIKNNRLTYGKKEFNIDADYIQDEDTAKSLMSWLTSRITNKYKTVSVDIFADPTIQLGDIVNINYKRGGIDQSVPESARFVVYNINYKRDGGGPSMTLYLNEVPNG